MLQVPFMVLRDINTSKYYGNISSGISCDSIVIVIVIVIINHDANVTVSTPACFLSSGSVVRSLAKHEISCVRFCLFDMPK
jgi:hypothetical protein